MAVYHVRTCISYLTTVQLRGGRHIASTLISFPLSVLPRFNTGSEKNGKEAPVWGVAQFGEMSYPGR